MEHQMKHTRKTKRAWMMLIAILAALSLVAAACGDDDDDTTQEPAEEPAAEPAEEPAAEPAEEPAAEPAEEPAAEPAEEPAAEPAEEPKEPLKVMTISAVETNLSPFKEAIEVAKVYGQYINDRGGVAGHPIEVITCDGMSDPNVSQACARQAVDEDVVAVIGGFEYDLSLAVPILEEAGIAFIHHSGVTGPEFSSPISFLLGADNAMQHAVTYIMNEDGCEAPAFAYIDIYVDYLTALAQQGWDHFGVFGDTAKTIALPAEAGDYSAQAALAEGHDCVWLSLASANAAAFLAGMRTVGSDMRVYGAQGLLNEDVAAAYTELTEGGIVLNSYPNWQDTVWDEYRAALIEYDAPPSSEYSGLASLGTWGAYVMFKDIVELIDGDITAASFLETTLEQDALQSMWGPTMDLSKDGPQPGFPRVLNFVLTFDRIGPDGEMVPTGEFVDFAEAVSGG